MDDDDDGGGDAAAAAVVGGENEGEGESSTKVGSGRWWLHI